MSIKQSISLLIVSALLVLPSSIARAGDIDVQTANVRGNCRQDGGINIQSRSPRVIVISSSIRQFYLRQHWPKLNRTSAQHLD